MRETPNTTCRSWVRYAMKTFNTEEETHRTKKTMNTEKFAKRLRKQGCAIRMKPYIIHPAIFSSLQLWTYLRTAIHNSTTILSVFIKTQEEEIATRIWWSRRFHLVCSKIILLSCSRSLIIYWWDLRNQWPALLLPHLNRLLHSVNQMMISPWSLRSTKSGKRISSSSWLRNSRSPRLGRRQQQQVWSQLN